MKMITLPKFNRLVAVAVTAILLALVTTLLAPTSARATIVGPYTANANTLFLLHFDEASGYSTTNVGPT
jgi:hypothetical protein